MFWLLTPFVFIIIWQDLYEEVNVITRGGNYGWRLYEGPYPYNPPATPGGTTPLNSITPMPPVLVYNHSEVNKIEGSASITGGYFYRSTTDPCMYGRWVFSALVIFSPLYYIICTHTHMISKRNKVQYEAFRLGTASAFFEHCYHSFLMFSWYFQVLVCRFVCYCFMGSQRKPRK